MDDKNELERIIGAFDSDAIEDVDSAPEGGDSPETQSERLERLHQEGKLTDDEFELLQKELIENNKSSSEPSVPPDSQDRDAIDWLPEATANKIIEVYREGIGNSNPYSGMGIYRLQIAALPSDASVQVMFVPGQPPAVAMNLTESKQQERFEDCIAQNPPYEEFKRMGSLVSMRLNVIPGGYQGELSDEDIVTEINHLFQVIANTYGMTLSDLSAGSITVSAQ